MTKNISPREWEAISAYLDGQLNPKDQARLEARLKDSVDLRTALDDLQKMRIVLRAQPKVRAPRNFTLTPEMVGRRARPAQAWNVFSILRLSSAFAALLLVLVFIGDFFTGAPTIAPQNTIALDQPNVMMEAAPNPDERAFSVMEAEEPPPTTKEALAGAMKAYPATAAETPPPELETDSSALPSLKQSSGAAEPPAASLLAPDQAMEQSGGGEMEEAQAQPLPGLVDQVDLRIAEVVLAIVALVSGLGAYWLRRSEN